MLLGTVRRVKGLPPPRASRGAFFLFGLVSIGSAASACGPPPRKADAAKGPAPAPSPVAPAPPAGAPWSSTIRATHPLVGRIWDPAAHGFVERATLEARLATARFVLLGEKHDNADHHRLQRELLAALVARGRRPSVVFEMVDVDDQSKLDGAGKDAEALGVATAWDKRGWDWSLYRPLVAFALAHDLPVVAGNFPRGRIKALFHPPTTAGATTEGVSEAEQTALGVTNPLPEAARVALEKELAGSHCGHLPKEHLPAFVLAQRLRDGQMAERLDTRAATGAEGGAVLIAGHGHVRTDRGVPWYLRTRTKSGAIATVAFFEVQAGLDAPADYAGLTGGTAESLPFDAVWFTPALDDDDPCKGH